MSTIITMGNFKGGVGKTTTSCMVAYNLADKGYKTLIADLDPQGNSTDIMLKTKANFDNKIATFDQTLMKSVEEEDLSKSIIRVNNNLDLLASAPDFAMFSRYMEYIKDYDERVKYLGELFDKIRDNYDYIILDTPPTIMSIFSDSALYMSDYCLIVMQTHEDSFKGASSFLEYLQHTVIDEFKAPRIDLIGILPVLMQGKAPVDEYTLNAAIERFDKDGEHNLLNPPIKYWQRIKRMSVNGISRETMYERRVIHAYAVVTDEMLRRIKEME